MTTQDKLAEALLPCPFCGAKAAMRITHGEYFVTCTRKGVCYGYHNPDQRDKDGRFMHGFLYAQDAIDMWNKRAHSTRAQPPAARVSDEMVERARSAFVKVDDGSTGITEAIRAALLAAQENPNG